MIENFPESFINFESLSGLDLSNNLFKEFPEVLEKIELYELDISGNPIKELPKKLKNIKLKGEGKYI